VQDSLGREDSSAAQAEDAKFEDRRGFIIDPVVDAGVGATRRRKDDTAGELKIRGNSKIHSPAPLRDAGLEAIREIIHRRRQRNEDSGRPGKSSLAQPEDAKPGATWEPHRRRSWRSEPSGQPETSRPAKLRDARREETRASIAGKAGRSRTRGNPNPHRRRNWWNEDSGRPGNSLNRSR
jgi:hypothetical protein